MGYSTKTAVTSKAGARKRYGVRDNLLVMQGLRLSQPSPSCDFAQGEEGWGRSAVITYGSKAFAAATASDRAF
jgi:hypothetical protein